MEFLKELVKRGESADKGYFQYAHIVAVELPKHLRESLDQLVNGPVFDGNVLGKQYRDELIEIGLGIRVCYLGEQGFTGATYFAYSVNKIIKDIAACKISE